jgi:hypothetical protein
MEVVDFGEVFKVTEGRCEEGKDMSGMGGKEGFPFFAGEEDGEEVVRFEVGGEYVPEDFRRKRVDGESGEESFVNMREVSFDFWWHVVLKNGFVRS